MTTCFFYGPMADRDVIAAVIGVDALSATEECVLAGWSEVQVEGVSYATLVRDRDSEVRGLLLKSAAKDVIERIAHYEGDCETVEVEVEASGSRYRAVAFADGAVTDSVWDRAAWESRYKDRFLSSVREVMNEAAFA